MDIIFIVGRILFGVIFLASGIGHLAAREAMVGYAQYKKLPLATLLVPVSGIMLILGALSVVAGVYPAYGALLLALFLIPTAFIFHNFWKETDAQAKMTSQISFNKDISLAGAAIILFYIFSTVEDLPGLLLP
ncbi:MAG: hypothetical protein RIS09_1243 [Actinomycetota bacterium]|jgi:uncharacterized membrane protein YphA (DoxX/SURF4 family)